MNMCVYTTSAQLQECNEGVSLLVDRERVTQPLVPALNQAYAAARVRIYTV